MKTKSKLYVGVAVVLGVAALAWAFAPRAIEVEVATAVRGPFETTIDEDGKTRVRDRFTVSAPLAGLLTRITLREGDAVEAGAVLAQLSPVLAPMLDARTRQEQQERVAVAQAQVQRAQARIGASRVAWQRARNEAQRSTQLAAQGFVSPTKLETDQLAVDAAQKEIESAQEDLHVAQHGVAQARAALVAVQQGASGTGRSFAVRAPVAGRVLKVAQTSEGVVALGTPLLEIGDTQRLEVVAELLTTDALRVGANARVVIERWGGDGTLEGQVRHIEPAAFTKISALGVEEQRVRALIDITTDRARWRALGDGYRVGVRIVTLTQPDALWVPVSAVFPRADAQGGGMAVFVVDGGRARLVPVSIGARNGSQAWVKDGLQPGTRVIVYPSAAVKEGVRVKVRSV